MHFTVSFWIMLPVSALIAAGFGVLFGAPTLRLRGDYLAIVTLGFGEIVPIVVRNVDSVTNGAAGLNGIQAPGSSATASASPPGRIIMSAIALVALLIFVSMRLRDSRIGRAWMAIREDETAAAAMGVDRTRTKLLAFAIGAAFAGATGTFYVAKLQTATPEMFGFPVSVMILVMVVLGGMGSVWGVVLGAVVLQLLQSWFLEDISGWIHDLGDRDRPAMDAADRPDPVDRADLRPDPGVHDAVSPRRADPRHAQAVRPELRAAARRGAARRLQRAGGVWARFAQRRHAGWRCKGVTVRYGGLVALNTVDLAVPAGGVVAVIGPNGSGKSTLFNAITGLTPADGGAIRFDGKDLLGLPPHRDSAEGRGAHLPEYPPVHQSVGAGQRADRPACASENRSDRAVFRPPRHAAGGSGGARLGDGNPGAVRQPAVAARDQTVSHLSYANRRRVEIARALASRPKILLLDEPTAGMNPAETLELAEQIKSLHALGLTILLIEHKLDVVTRLADKVVVLDHGEKIAEGTPDEVRRNEAVLEAYLGRGTLAKGMVDA